MSRRLGTRSWLLRCVRSKESNPTRTSPLLFLELLNIAGSRWNWSDDALPELAAALNDLGFDIADANLLAVASWVIRGLTAYDASYVALAEERGLVLGTDDERILELAPDLSRPLVGGMPAG